MLACPSCGSVYVRSQEFCGLDGTRLEEVVEDPLLGRAVGRYVIDRPLGSGGMARVYRGRHEVLDERVAIKVLHGELSADKHLAKRFEREARSLSRIRHPNVVEVRDFGQTSSGLLYMVMELVDGHTLAEALRRAGPLPPGEAGRIAADIALGLGAAHDTGYVHRDLKPGNVVLDVRSSPSAVKILDFGLVGLVEGSDSDTPLTRQGTFFGTPTYMSPEQSAGERAVPASDMYALGVVLYELLTGSPPFFGDIRQLAQQHMQTEPPRPPLDFGGLTGLSLELLSKNPAERPRSNELVEAISQLPLTLPPTVGADRDAPFPPRRRASSRARVRPRSGPVPSAAMAGGSSPGSDPRPAAPPPPASAPRSMSVQVPIERDEFSVMDGTSQIYEREALGPTRRGRLAAAGLVLLVAGGAAYALWQWETRGPPPRSITVTEEGPTLSDENRDRLAARRRAPARTRPPRARNAKAPARAAPRPSAPEPVPIPPLPKPKPTEGALPEGHVVYDLYAVYDAELGALLVKEGLQWADLQAADPTTTRQWSTWHQARTSVPEAEMRAAKARLEAQVAQIGGAVSRERLALRLIEVRGSFRKLPNGVAPLERSALRERFRALEVAIRKDPLEAPPPVLMTRLGVLEADIARTAAAVPPEDEALDRSLRKLEVKPAPEPR